MILVGVSTEFVFGFVLGKGAKMAQNVGKLEAKMEPRRPETVLKSKVTFRTALGELHRNV